MKLFNVAMNNNLLSESTKESIILSLFGGIYSIGIEEGMNSLSNSNIYKSSSSLTKIRLKSTVMSIDLIFLLEIYNKSQIFYPDPVLYLII